ncbi:hypothetical protein PIB30_080518 [Stylosanthes scabra]|uniref:Uncharacterized protein n=1 Tax=Stylosanthes scabra TaxID=79078 RepID=A0ABU6VRA5_9FABA|nr:hypothetical protein [Stylosanthes scabra]
MAMIQQQLEEAAVEAEKVMYVPPQPHRPCPKSEGRAQEELKRTREARRLDKKPKKSPTKRQPRARALLSLIRKSLPVTRPRDPDGAPVPPHFVTPKTRTLRVRAMEVAHPRGDSRIHLNEGYFGDFTFPGQGPSISQAQFDLYGGGTAETQQHILSFHQFEP